MMLVWPGWLLKGPGTDAHDAAAERAGHDAGLAGLAAERAGD